MVYSDLSFPSYSLNCLAAVLASHIVFSVWDVFRPGALFERGCVAKFDFLEFSQMVLTLELCLR